MQKWEYCVIVRSREGVVKTKWKWSDDGSDKNDTEKFNELGLLGWELVSALAYDSDGTTRSYRYLFKRPIP